MSKRVQTDNAHFAAKVFLRETALRNLQPHDRNVLDCFAGTNRIWSRIPHGRYLGIEKESDKGANIHADNLKILPSLDLTKYNVIDVDAYGSPAEQLNIILHKQLQPNTTIFYTYITNPISKGGKVLTDHFGVTRWFDVSPILLQSLNLEFFYGYLYDLGVRKVNYIEYKEYPSQYVKHYGYFRI